MREHVRGKALEPGILAEANQNVLYASEVNSLSDHIADNTLDAAATGWNTVEREGISASHPLLVHTRPNNKRRNIQALFIYLSTI